MSQADNCDGLGAHCRLVDIFFCYQTDRLAPSDSLGNAKPDMPPEGPVRRGPILEYDFLNPMERRGHRMLADRYDLGLSTASAAARDAYVQGCRPALTFYPGAIAAFDRPSPPTRFRVGARRQGAGADVRGRGRGGARVDGRGQGTRGRAVRRGRPAISRSSTSLLRAAAEAALAAVPNTWRHGRAMPWCSAPPRTPTA